jgi:hypothetical protein
MRDYDEGRAPDYDDWWLGRGRAALGDVPVGWADEVAASASSPEARRIARQLVVDAALGGVP